jgi:hypothetical protein
VVDVMAPDVQNWRQRRAFSGPGVEMIDNNRIMAKKQRITDEDLVSRGLAASTTELALPPAGCEMASVGAPRYNFRLRRRESVSLVETKPQKTRQTSNMDTFTTGGRQSMYAPGSLNATASGTRARTVCLHCIVDRQCITIDPRSLVLTISRCSLRCVMVQRHVDKGESCHA